MWAKRAVALGASVVLALGVVSLGPASADPEEDKKKVDAAVEAAGDDLRAANAEVEKAIADLQEVRQLLPAARKELAEAREAAAVAEEADRAAQAELEQATAAAIRAEQERAEVEFQIQDLQSRVGNLARAVYQNGAFADFDLLITAQSPTDLSDRAQALDAVSRANNQTLSQMAGIRAELALKEARLEVLRQEVDDKRQQAAIALSEANIARDKAAAAKLKVDLLVAQKATALDVAASERAKVLKQYKSVPGRAAAHRRPPGQAGGGGGRAAGRRWLAELRPHRRRGLPVADRGRAASARASGRASTRCTGTARATPASTWARPAGRRSGPRPPASSSSTPPGGPYGNHTLISHGNGLFSMYAHQSRFGAEEGQTVKKGDVIGYVGSTGYSTGPHLHFEIHVGGTPYDPLGWFGAGDKEPVRC